MTKSQLQKLLDETVAFTQTAAYQSLLHTRRVDIENIKGQILSRPPVSVEDIAVLNQLHGQWQTLEEEIKIFETAVADLKDRISKVEVVETNSQQDEETQNEN